MFKFLLLLLTIAPFTSFSSVTYIELLAVNDALQESFKILRPSPRETLAINPVMPGLSPTFWWDLDTVHASYVRSDSAKGTEHQVYLMGGFARLKDMSPEGLLLTACHEMGHGIGGNPKKTPASPHDIGSTTEGQADYFATKTCLPIALRYLKIKSSFTVKPIYQKLCTLQTQHSQNDCHRLFFALESDISFYKFLGSTVKLEAFSSHIQRSLNLNPTYYPDAQCRLDTSIHGILGLERPECWFPGGERNGALRD